MTKFASVLMSASLNSECTSFGGVPNRSMRSIPDPGEVVPKNGSGQRNVVGFGMHAIATKVRSNGVQCVGVILPSSVSAPGRSRPLVLATCGSRLDLALPASRSGESSSKLVLIPLMVS